MSKVATQSSAVIGLPSENVASGADAERHGHQVGGDLDRLGDEAVVAVGLVGGARHQAVERQLAHALGSVALEDERIEAVEGVERAGADRDQPAALRRLRIDVVEVLEVRRDTSRSPNADSPCRTLPAPELAKRGGERKEGGEGADRHPETRSSSPSPRPGGEGRVRGSHWHGGD